MTAVEALSPATAALITGLLIPLIFVALPTLAAIAMTALFFRERGRRIDEAAARHPANPARCTCSCDTFDEVDEDRDPIVVASRAFTTPASRSAYLPPLPADCSVSEAVSQFQRLFAEKGNH